MTLSHLGLALLLSIIRASNAATYPVTIFADAAATASGSAIGAGDGQGMPGDLRYTILLANKVGGTNTIDFVCVVAPCTIALNGPLPPIESNLTIDGGSLGTIIIDGSDKYRVFFADTGIITLANLQVQDALAAGGAGGNGAAPGGGGAGFGAGLFVNQPGAVVTVRNDHFLNCNVVGGNGGPVVPSYNSGGGGGLGFAGGDGDTTGGVGSGGGGGVIGPGKAASMGGGGGAGGGGGNIGGNAYGTNNAGAGGNGGFGGGGGPVVVLVDSAAAGAAQSAQAINAIRLRRAMVGSAVAAVRPAECAAKEARALLRLEASKADWVAPATPLPAWLAAAAVARRPGR